MIKVFALTGFDGEIYAVSESREGFDQEIETQPLMGGCNVIEIDYNDDEVTERGIALRDRIQATFAKGIVQKLHIDKRAGFYAMHIDDRYQMVSDIIHKEGDFAPEKLTPFKFNDSHRAPMSKQPKTDVEELCRSTQ